MKCDCMRESGNVSIKKLHLYIDITLLSWLLPDTFSLMSLFIFDISIILQLWL